jgi:hypothetical protein
MEKKDLFEVMLTKVKEVSDKKGYQMPQAFVKWFAEVYLLSLEGILEIVILQKN